MESRPMMLSEVCHELKNYFLKNREKDIHYGTYTIKDGAIGQLDFLQEGQYFRIVGSTFNDGVHRYLDYMDLLVDETFDGAVWAMAVPPSVVALASEIGEWTEKNEDAINSPYQSESFGGYSYSKGGAYNQGGSVTWVSQFESKLKNYRRIHL